MTYLIYCIDCEETVLFEEGGFCFGHVKAWGGESDFHCAPFPLAYCPPPASDWDLMPFDEWLERIEINKPSDDEILTSDLDAINLVEELEAR